MPPYLQIMLGFAVVHIDLASRATVTGLWRWWLMILIYSFSLFAYHFSKAVSPAMYSQRRKQAIEWIEPIISLISDCNNRTAAVWGSFVERHHVRFKIAWASWGAMAWRRHQSTETRRNDRRTDFSPSSGSWRQGGADYIPCLLITCAMKPVTCL